MATCGVVALLTHPSEYAEEAATYVQLIRDAWPRARTLLELGGGGNNASHLKRHVRCTVAFVGLRPEG